MYEAADLDVRRGDIPSLEMADASDSEHLEGSDSERDSADQSRWVATLYAELRALAQSELAHERAGHTLSATALVNEVYLKLGPRSSHASDRGVFFAAAAQAMRRILVDHARGKRRLKRGGGRPMSSDESLGNVPDESTPVLSLDAIALDEALTRLALEHDDAARVVELRFFAGLTDGMIAEILRLNERTVRRHWTFAKAWLSRELASDGSPPGTRSST